MCEEETHENVQPTKLAPREVDALARIVLIADIHLLLLVRAGLTRRLDVGRRADQFDRRG